MSQLSNQNNVQLAAGTSVIVVPSLIVRRAETTVQLGSGETFAIAGLLQDSANVAGSGLPILGDLPILGALFRSDKFQRNETELVIVVTPYIVRPVADPTELRLPTDGWQAPSDLERILLLRQTGRHAGSPAQRASRRRISRAMPGSSCSDGDALMLRRLICTVAERLHVLSGEENLLEQVKYEPGATGRLIETLRRRYNFIIVDAPFTGLELHHDLLMLGHQRILVPGADTGRRSRCAPAVGIAKWALQVHRGLLVLNRLKRPGTLSQQQIDDALKIKVDVVIPDLPKYVENAASIGEPAALNAKFYKGITALAAQAAAAFLSTLRLSQ